MYLTYLLRNLFCTGIPALPLCTYIYNIVPCIVLHIVLIIVCCRSASFKSIEVEEFGAHISLLLVPRNLMKQLKWIKYYPSTMLN